MITFSSAKTFRGVKALAEKLQKQHEEFDEAVTAFVDFVLENHTSDDDTAEDLDETVGYVKDSLVTLSEPLTAILEDILDEDRPDNGQEEEDGEEESED